jgi:hypothetical protein
MKNKHINVLKAAWILITIFYSSLLWAQPYSGGNNSGAFASATPLANCTAIRFFGGDNDGLATAATSLLDCTLIRFWGDIADGSTASKINIFDCTPIRFSGDTSDGGTTAKTNDFDCTPLRFFGDTADGAIAVATNDLNCTNQRFFGDTADGHATAKFILLRNFLGNDTSVIVICNTDGFNLLSLYQVPGYTYNWNTANPAIATLGNYQLIATNVSGCIDTAQATLKQEIAKWNGSISSNWHTAGNWDNNTIPTEKSHVIIPSNNTNPCIISDSDATAASVQAKTSGSFSIINNKKLIISGTCISLPTGL